MNQFADMIETAQYAVTVTQAVALEPATAVDRLGISDYCLECDTVIEDADAEHVTGTATAEDGEDFRYVIVGCGGYWQVDPAWVGLPRGNWQPPTY